jgi:peptide/nickel transport system substrate-binding protein
MKKSLLIPMIIILISTSLLVFTSCAKSTSTSVPTSSSLTPLSTGITPKAGGVLKFNQAFGATTFGYPPEMVVSGAVYIANSCIEPIVLTDLAGNFQPTGLTTAFTVAPDGKSITLTLRKGVIFHDDTDWNATAAKWNLDQIIASKSAAGTSTWTSVDVIDDYTLRINVTQYKITDASTLGRFGGEMISPTSAQKYSINWTRTNPVGTGPFKFVSFQPDQMVKYQRFDSYWGGKPYLDEVDIPLIVNATTAEMAFQAGDIDVFSPSGAIAADMMSQGYPYAMAQAIGVGYNLVPDTANPNSVFNDLKVRQAVEYAIDKQAIAKAVGYGLWDALEQPAPKGNSGYDPNLQTRAYNVQKAKDLLAAAGYPNGFQTTIIGDAQRMNKDALTAVQQDLKEVGINADLNIMPLPGWTDKDTKGWSNGLLVFFGPAVEPFASALQMFFASNSGHMYSMQRPAGFDDLLNKALVATDAAAVKKSTLDAVDLWYNNATTIPLFVSHQIYFYQKYVHDLGFFVSSRDWTPEKAWISK